MNEGWIISKLLETFDDSKKKEFKGYFEESLYKKLLDWESSQFDDNEIDVLVDFFRDMIVNDTDYFDDKLEDPWFTEEEGGVYYQVRVGLSIEKLDIHFIYFYEDGSFEEFNSFNEMEKDFWNE
jgi:hypothetical protein